MLPTTPNGVPAAADSASVPSEPKLTRRTINPRGVIQKNIKGLLYFGAVALLIFASVVSSFRKKPAITPDKAKATTAGPTAADNTANSVAALHAQLATEQPRQQDSRSGQALGGTPAQQAAATGLGPNGLPMAGNPCVPGQPCSASGYVATGQGSGPAAGQAQLSPEEQEAQQLAARERERLYTSRFSSNIAFSRSSQSDQPAQQGTGQAQNAFVASVQPGQVTSFTPARAAGEQPASPTLKRSAEVNIDAAGGQPYVIYEGLTLDTVLMNRLDGDAAGPVKVLVSNPVYSHDHQHVLIPEGTIVLGEARKIGAGGFGQQRRVAVVFHRMLMPDGYSVDLDQFHGLDQIGEEALKDKVNNHYLQVFGTSIALGVISGAAQITEGGTGYSSTGSQQFVNGAAAGISSQATTVLDRFIQIPPTITIREGHRVKVYFTQDMLLPAYTNHTIPQSF
jgi:type IV secretory pathway VirB10-like protein